MGSNELNSEGVDELRGKVIDEQQARRMGIYKPYQLVFDPTPKQKWHKQLVALIPPLGHELDCPLEFEQYPYAKYEWLRVMELDGGKGVITPAKREMLYGYCLMVEHRKALMLEWDGKDDYKAWFDKKRKRAYAKMDYLMHEIQRLNRDIDIAAWKLGLYRLNSNMEVEDDEAGIEYSEDTGNEECYVTTEDEQAEEGAETGDDTSGEGYYIAPEDDSDLFD